MLAVHHLPPPLPAHGPDLSAKESLSALSLAYLLVELGYQRLLTLIGLIASGFFQLWIIVGWISNRLVNSETVWSTRRAARSYLGLERRSVLPA